MANVLKRRKPDQMAENSGRPPIMGLLQSKKIPLHLAPKQKNIIGTNPPYIQYMYHLFLLYVAHK